MGVQLNREPAGKATSSTPPQSPTAAPAANQKGTSTREPSQEMMRQTSPTSSKEEAHIPEEEIVQLGCCYLCPGVHPLDVYEVVGETTWMTYCICCGWGSAPRLGGCWLRLTGLGCAYNLEPVPSSGVDIDEDG